MPKQKKPSAGKSTKSGKRRESSGASSSSQEESSDSGTKTSAKQRNSKFGFGASGSKGGRVSSLVGKQKQQSVEPSPPTSLVGALVDDEDESAPEGTVHYPEELKKLTAKEQAFVLEYMKCKNATQAAELAGYGSSRASSKTLGTRVLSKVHIQVAIEAMMKPMIVQANVSVDRLVNELAKYAFGKLEDFVKIQYDMAGNVVGAKLMLKDKLTAIKLLGDHLGMFKNSEPLDNERPSLHLHFHPNMSAEESRQRLLDYLRQRK